MSPRIRRRPAAKDQHGETGTDDQQRQHGRPGFALIWASPHSNILYDSHVEPSNSWATINVASTAGRQDKLSFYFLWDNPSEFYAAIHARSSLALNGHCSASANGSISYVWNVGGHISSIYLRAELNPWQWWDQPPTLIRPDTEGVLSLIANAGFLDDAEAQSVAGVYDLGSNMLVIPPKGVMVLRSLYLFLALSMMEAFGSILAIAISTLPAHS